MRSRKYWLTMLALALPAQAYGWGFAGHEYIGETTYHYLTPQARTWVEQHLQRLDEESLATATTWADRVRTTEEGRLLGPLHFANIPPQYSDIDMQRDCPARRCVVGAAHDALDVLFDQTAEPMEQADQLRKFTHWITDLHQPLHLGFARDRGGNDTPVRLHGEQTNLHLAWDVQLVRLIDLPSPQQIVKTHPLPDEGDTNKDWYQAFELWANESNHLAREYAYAGVDNNPELDDEYIENAKSVIERQLVLAAQRMARIINAAAAAN